MATVTAWLSLKFYFTQSQRFIHKNWNQNNSKVTTVLVWFFMNKSLKTSLSSSQEGIKISGLQMMANSNCRLEMLLILCVLLTLQKGKEIIFGIYNFSNRKLKFKKSRSFSNHRLDPNYSTNFILCKFWPFKKFFLSSQWIFFQFLKTDLNISINLICSGSKGSSERFRGVGGVIAFISSDFLIGLWIIMMRWFNDFFCLLFWALKKRELGVRQNNAGFV